MHYTIFAHLQLTTVLSDDTTALLEERAARANIDIGVNSFSGGANVPMPTSVTYTDYENPFSLVDESSGAPHVAKLSGNAWVGCGGDVYVLECMGKGHIRIEPAKADEGMKNWTMPGTIY